MNKLLAILMLLGAIGGFGLSTRTSYQFQGENRYGAPLGEPGTVYITSGDRIFYVVFGALCMAGSLYFIVRIRLEESTQPTTSSDFDHDDDDYGMAAFERDDTPQPAGYHRLPGTLQWSPGQKEAVDKTTWKPCDGCGRAVPVQLDKLPAASATENTLTWTYVCPFCSHCHVGSPYWSENAKQQKVCHDCGTELGEAYQCPKCKFPRGWMRVKCPCCKSQQPVFAPHWVAGCDMFRLECVDCESVFYSLFIC